MVTVLLISLSAFSAHAKHLVNVVVLVESSDHKKYELHVLSPDLPTSGLARRLIKESCQETAMNYSLIEVLSNRGLIKEAISKKLSDHNLTGSFSVFRMFRDKSGIKKTE